MKRLIMILAIAVAANFVGFGIQSASAVDAHHPAAQATKGKKVKAAPKKAKTVKASRYEHALPHDEGADDEGADDEMPHDATRKDDEMPDDGDFQRPSNGNDAQTLTLAKIVASCSQEEKHMSSFLFSRAGLVLIGFMIIAGALPVYRAPRACVGCPHLASTSGVPADAHLHARRARTRRPCASSRS